MSKAIRSQMGKSSARVKEAIAISEIRLVPRAKSESGSRNSLIIGKAPI